MQQQHVNDTRIGFLNARGMGDRTFRQYLLAQYRRRFHILALAETWCPGRNEEREWAKDWKKSGGGGLGFGATSNCRQPTRF